MKSLIGIEFTRLRWRRAALVMLLVGLVAPVIIAAAQLWDTRSVSDAEIAQAKADAASDIELTRDTYEQCLAHPRRYDAPKGASGTDLEQHCVEWTGYGLYTPDYREYLYRTPLDLVKAIDETGTAVATILIVLAVFLGTTFVGADWASGSMSNQLLFEPRRTRVWWAKALTVIAAGAALTILGMAVFWAILTGGAALRDLPINAELLGDIGGHAGRAALLGAGAALVGFALTMLFRSTVATLGLVVIVTGLSSLIVGLAPIDDPMRWQPTMHAIAFLQNGMTYDFWPRDCWDGCDGEPREITMLRASVFLGTLLLAAVAASLTSFRRRDVP